MGVRSFRNIFLFISLCCLWWNCVCDSGPGHTTNVLHGSEYQENDPVGGPSSTPVSGETKEHILVDHVNSLSKDESSDSSGSSEAGGVNNDEKNYVDNPTVKTPKFGEPFKRPRRKESQEQFVRKKVKLTHSEPPVVEKRSVQETSEQKDSSSPLEAESLLSDQTAGEEKDKQREEKVDVEHSQIPEVIPVEKEQLAPSVGKPVATQDSSPVIAETKDATVVQESVAPSATSQTAEDSSDHSHHPHSDAMPSFDEWKKMMLAEQQKGGHAVPSVGPSGKKLASQKRRRNYASYECGAKIVASNPEGEGSSRILNEMVDEYMLNPCKAKIWFVIELCESVQASQIELANFELFSSCPKDFAVYSSDNFPTRDWIPLGSFTATEQRVLQNFPLKQEGFGKFIKIELQSHYGKEHYCPLSVVRIFGTSMVDEYEEMETLSSHHVSPEDELDRLDLPAEDKSASNLFGSATDAVYSIVKKAAQVLVQRKTVEGEDDEKAEKNASDSDGCKFINNSCLDKMKSGKVTATDFFLSASSMRRSLFQHLRRCDQCISVSRPSYYSVSHPQCRFFQAALGPVMFNTICDWFRDNLATLKNLPASVDISDNTTIRSTKPSSLPPTVISVIIDHNRSDINERTRLVRGTEESILKDSLEVTSGIRTVKPSYVIDESEMVSPTKTLSGSASGSRVDYDGSAKTETPVIPKESDKSTVVPSVAYVASDSVSSSSDNVIVSSAIEEKVPVSQEDSMAPTNVTKDGIDAAKKTEPNRSENGTTVAESSVVDTVISSSTVTDSGMDDFTDEFRSADERFGDVRDTSATAVVGSATLAQKESVFMRMSNRIKALELNMSLSSQYLQELSQRYRRQMEEMQRAFNRTIGTLNDTARKAAEKDMKQQEVIGQLQSEVANLTEAVSKLMAERDATSHQMMEVHIFLMVVEAIVMVTIMSLCVRRISLMLANPSNTPAQQVTVAPSPSHPDLKRRNSAEVSPVTPAVKVQKRSVSEEVIPSGDVPIVIEPAVPLFKGPHVKVKKKNKKRKGIPRSVSNPNMSPRKAALSSSFKKKLSQDDACATAGIIFSPSKAVQCKKPNHTCENCKGSVVCSLAANHVSWSLKNKRPSCEPLKNLTNGHIIDNVAESVASTERSSTESLTKEKDKFNLKKFLRLQKRESI